MNRPLSRALRLIAFFALVVLSLRPDATVERGLDVLLAPVRMLAELASPVAWFQRRAARAAEGALRAQEDRERAHSAQVRADQRRFALPGAWASEGRAFVHAEVVGRAPDDPDEIHVAVAGGDTAGLAARMPVVVGDVYVGRVAAVDEPWPGHARVALVTGRDFNVGAVLAPHSQSARARARSGLVERSGAEQSGPADAPVRMVVGGLLASERARSGELLLALRAPSRREKLSGAVEVDESLAAQEAFAREARGFRLGHVVDEGGHFGIVPEVDYENGLYQVAIVVPASLRGAGSLAADDPLEDGGWIRARRLAAGDPAPWRASLKLGAGRWNGVEEGAAVAFGARLVGRVARAGAWLSDVQLLGDPGFFVTGLASVDGRVEPLVLGRLVALGRDEDGRYVFRWPAVVPLPQAAPDESPWVAARIFTGAGESGIPAGLAIGQAALPRGPGPHRIWIEDVAPAADLATLWVRRSHAARMDALAAAQGRAGQGALGGELP